MRPAPSDRVLLPSIIERLGLSVERLTLLGAAVGVYALLTGTAGDA
jgi:hypothetical protein